MFILSLQHHFNFLNFSDGAFKIKALTKKIKGIFTKININGMKTAAGHSLYAAKNQVCHKLGYLILSFFSFFFIFSCNCVPMVEMQAFEACDNISDNQVFGTVKASAPDGQPLTYRLTDNAGGLFEIGEDNGELSLASGRSLDYTMATQHTITVLVSNTVAIGDTSTANFQINVNTAPLLGSNNYVFTYSSNVSVMLNNRGTVESFTHSSNFPMGLDFASQNGQLSIQGSPRAVTLDESNQISAVPIDAVLHNSCGSNSFRAMITVNPIYVSGDLSPNIVAETNAETSSNNSNYLGQLHRADAIPFASGGTGAWNDPVIIGLNEEMLFTNFGYITSNDVSIRTNIIGFVVDFNGVEVSNFGDNPPSNYRGELEFAFYIRFVNFQRYKKYQLRIIKINDSISDVVSFFRNNTTHFSGRSIFFDTTSVGTTSDVSFITNSTTTSLYMVATEGSSLGMPKRTLEGTYGIAIMIPR